jgi:Outer membrane lipoprotein carrier protein LolA
VARMICRGRLEETDNFRGRRARELCTFRMLRRAGRRMLISRRTLLAGAVSFGVSARALAEDGRAPGPAVGQARQTAERPAYRCAKALGCGNRREGQRFLQHHPIHERRFCADRPDGRRSEDLLVLLRPGRMLFRYKPPQQMEIVADGRSLEVRDLKLATQDLHLIGQTSLKFLLSDRIDLANDNKVKRIEMDGHAATIEIEDKARLGGQVRDYAGLRPRDVIASPRLWGVRLSGHARPYKANRTRLEHAILFT